MEKKDLETEVEKKLRLAANRIKKSRQGKKETLPFGVIQELLKNSEESSEDISTDLSKGCSIVETDKIPPTAPGVTLFQQHLLFNSFDQHSLHAKPFLITSKRSIFGRDFSKIQEDTLRGIIANNVFESLSCESGCKELNVYVLYLESVVSDASVVAACDNLLRHCPTQLTPADILPVFINYGTTADLLCAPAQPKLEFNNFGHSSNTPNQLATFPFSNLEKVGCTLLEYAKQKRIRVDENTAALLTGLSRICLDWKVRRSSLLTIYSTLLSTLAVQALEQLSVDTVTQCLHLNNEHPCNQLDTCLVLDLTANQLLLESLVLTTIKTALKADSLSLTPPLQISHIQKILRQLIKQEYPLVTTFIVLKLVTLTLPSVTATLSESKDINLRLTAIESVLTQSNDSTDSMRIRSTASRLRSLLAMTAGSRFNVRVVLSPRKP